MSVSRVLDYFKEKSRKVNAGGHLCRKLHMLEY